MNSRPITEQALIALGLLHLEADQQLPVDLVVALSDIGVSEEYLDDLHNFV
jgi:hypothetical protein